MNPERILGLLNKVKDKKLSPKKALETLKTLPFADLGFARVDLHRHLRKGFPEVIYCSGKTVEQIVKIAQEIRKSGSVVLGTRLEEEVFDKLKIYLREAKYFPQAKIFIIETERRKKFKLKGNVLVVSAGTSDIPVAEEAALTCEVMGNRVERLYDVGVAGIHRFLYHLDKLKKAKVIIVVAGMEGALPSVVSGLVDKPVIAVPTSIGYGASFGGVAPLLAMLNSCASGVVVVTIDNGFGAGCAASLINQL
ncbi:MAG: nickel pincer cofactor biosynthesis protein LarB [candidate division Zixibacteria bacterium]|nr:nickel pincer cofactor biosynthesis protein LarB [candidate division Zixibacteria bacterium]